MPNSEEEIPATSGSCVTSNTAVVSSGDTVTTSASGDTLVATSSSSRPIMTSTTIKSMADLNRREEMGGVAKEEFLRWISTDGWESFLARRTPSPRKRRPRDRGTLYPPLSEAPDEFGIDAINETSHLSSTPMQGRDRARIRLREISSEPRLGQARGTRTGRLLDDDVSKTILELRESLDQDQELENQLTNTLEYDMTGVLTQIRADHARNVTKPTLRNLCRYIIRIGELGSFSTPHELVKAKREIESFQIAMKPDEGRSAILTPGWSCVYKMLGVAWSMIDNISDALGPSGRGTSRFAIGNNSAGSIGSELGLELQKNIIKTIAPLEEDQNIDDYINHFEYLTEFMDLPSRKRLLESKIGPRYINRVKGARNAVTWKAFRNKINEEMSEVKDDIAATMELSSLRQGEKSIEAYNDVTVNLLAKMNIIPETCLDTRTIITYVSGINNVGMRKGLLKDLRSTRFSATEKTLDFFMRKAKESESIERLATRGSPRFEGEVHVAADHGGLIPSNPCNRHDAAIHKNSECRIEPGICLYCKQKVVSWKFVDGSHQRECTAPRCTHCKVRGHNTDDCHRKGGGKRRPSHSNFNTSTPDKRQRRDHSGSRTKTPHSDRKGNKSVFAAIENPSDSEESFKE